MLSNESRFISTKHKYSTIQVKGEKIILKYFLELPDQVAIILNLKSVFEASLVGEAAENEDDGISEYIARIAVPLVIRHLESNMGV